MIDEIRLAQPFIPGDGNQHRKLARRQIAILDFAVEDFFRTLTRSMQKVGN